MAKERISATITPEANEILDAAADLAGVSRSQFVEIAVMACAKAIVQQVKVEKELAEQADERAERIQTALMGEEVVG